MTLDKGAEASDAEELDEYEEDDAGHSSGQKARDGRSKNRAKAKAKARGKAKAKGKSKAKATKKAARMMTTISRTWTMMMRTRTVTMMRGQETPCDQSVKTFNQLRQV
eukprot:s457_g1.t1